MLNAQQTAAVKYIDGPLLVLAGAGSGKTRVITQKIAYLIETCQHRASHIYALTFTNKAADEMRTRLASTLPVEARRGLHVSTFHTLGLELIKRDTAACHLNQGFSIFDEEDAFQLLRGLLPAARSNQREDIKRLQRQISAWKNELTGPNDVVLSDDASLWAVEAAKLYPRYQCALQVYNAVDFDDLIRLPVFLLSQYESIRAYWQRKIHHLLIDEYQDSNTSQYQLVKLLVGERARFTVVGDDDQSIYAWRGARPQNLAQLQQDFPQLNLIKLEQNYRSTVCILKAANDLIANNTHLFHKSLWSELGYGEAIRVLCCKDDQDEAEQVVSDLISHKLRKGHRFGDYAILYRGNHQSRVFEKMLRHHGIPYRISGGQSWFSRSEIKDILAYLKLVINEADDAAFLRVINTPKRGVGEATLSALGHYAKRFGGSLYRCCDHMALTEYMSEKPRQILKHFKQWFETVKSHCQAASVKMALKDMVESCGYEAYVYEQSESPLKAEKKMDNVWELLDWIGRLLDKSPETTLSEVIHKLILIDILDNADEQTGEQVQLMTLHASKGLEFPYVYLVGMEEELLPHRVSIEEETIEEERRLAYVGITRAQKALSLTLAKKRRRAGGFQDVLPSRFLEELPKDCLEWHGQHGVRDEAKSKALAKSHLAGMKDLLNSEV